MGHEARIEVMKHGPYRVTGDVEIYNAEGALVRHGGVWHLCRCGGSRNKPFCDITHGLKGFDGAERADHGPIAKRRTSYAADGVTVYDDRTISPDTLAHHKSDIIVGLARAFAGQKIEFAYPTQTTYTAAPHGTLRPNP